MARTTKTKNKKKSRSASPGVWKGPGARRGAIAVLAIACAGGAAWASWIGIERLERQAASIQRSDGPRVVIEWPVREGREGTWMPEFERARLVELTETALSERWGTYTGEGLAGAGRELESTGWFKGSPTLEHKDGRVHISGVWREPKAVVRKGEFAYLVSADARMLPLMYPADAELDALPSILGVRTEPPVRVDGIHGVGELWGAPVVAPAIALADALQRESFANQILGVDVARLNGEGQGKLEIVTKQGGRVVWGSAPGVFRPGEQDDATRLARLRRVNGMHGSINAGRDRLEIFGERVVIDQAAALPFDPPANNR